MRDRIKKILKENDFEWINDINPVSKDYIINKMYDLSHVGYRSNPKDSKLAESIYSLALNESQIDILFNALYNFGDYCHNEGVDIGHQEGYDEGERAGHRYGYDDGYDDGVSEMRDQLETERDKGYDEGYDEGMSDGYKKGYDEGVEITYHKAFEEGRAYESGIEVEDLERMESGFDPSEYDEDYDENY